MYSSFIFKLFIPISFQADHLISAYYH